LLLRFAGLLFLVFCVVIIVYIEGGLIDTRTNTTPGFLDCIYFVLVTVTTVGYGDIVPVGTTSRLTDAFLLTPIRFIVIFTFVGTAYQLVIKRFQEEYLMKRAVSNLNNHILICGFGNTGRIAAAELILQGTPPQQIVALDTNETALAEADALDVIAVIGDATREGVLKSVAVDRAAHVLICPGRDDTAVLTALTVHNLSPDARIIAICLEQENEKLLRSSGAHTIISRASAGGDLMAAATRRVHLVETMEDILTVGGALQLDERPARSDEVDKQPSELKNMAILRICRNGRYYDVSNLPPIESGDILIFVKSRKPQPESR